MSTVGVKIETSQWITEEADPNDSWDRANTDQSLELLEVYAVANPSSQPKMYGFHSEFEVDARRGDTVYVVVVQYSTGDTFGHDGGQIRVMDVFSERWKAEALEAKCRAVNRSEFSFEHDGKSYYADWTGYFERLENVTIYKEVVRNIKNK